MLACIRCGLCLSVRPTYQVTLWEEESPRGRIAMARALTEGNLALTDDLVERHRTRLLREVERMADVCRAACASEVRVARSAQEQDVVWAARRAVSPALGRAAPNKLGEDVVVPRAAIPEMVRRIRAIAEEHDLLVPIFGHAGDGNLHPNVLFDRRRPGEIERVETAAVAIFPAAIGVGGTLSGEHGIGTLKREFMEAPVGSPTLGVMADLKRLLDPKGALNPEKKLPTGSSPDGRSFLATLPTLDGIVPG